MDKIIIQLILGAIQGITEWLPVSSSGILTILNSNFFGVYNISELIHMALFLHFGTFLAALIYFRKDVFLLIKSLFNYKKSGKNTKKVLNFLLLSTLISGFIGLIILKVLTSFENYFEVTGKTITAFVAVLLLFTGFIQIKIKNFGLKKVDELKNRDGILLGFMQGLASLPGISRSGITISTLLLKKFDDTTTLRLSFLMSMPIVLFGNIFLNFLDFTQFVNFASFIGLLSSFIFGLLTIHLLMKISKKINFGWFILIFAFIMLCSLFL
jgi:undecaprenyl-diphosphatase